MLHDDDIDFTNFDNYECMQLIGRGVFSFVYKFRKKDTNKEYAFRFLNMNGNIIKFIDTIELFKVFDMPCIKKIHYYQHFFKKKNNNPLILQNLIRGRSHTILIISDFEKNRDLSYLLKSYWESEDKQSIMTSTIRSKIIFGIACGMKYLHEHKIIHRDLKPGHILLNENFEPVINICSCTEIMTGNNQGFAGTQLYMSPESIIGDKIGYASDVYSYSIILYSLFSKRFIFENGNDATIKSIFAIFDNILHERRFKRPDNIPDAFWSLIQECWKQNPDERPTFKEITEKLKGDEFIIDDKTDLEELHEYQRRVEMDELAFVQNQFYYLTNELNRK